MVRINIYIFSDLNVTHKLTNSNFKNKFFNIEFSRKWNLQTQELDRYGTRIHGIGKRETILNKQRNTYKKHFLN